MTPAHPAPHQRLTIEAELATGSYRFVRERLRLPMGIEASFGWLRHPPSVLVVPRCGDGQLLVLRRYRPAVGRWVLEFPSGPLEPGESPPEAGARLLRQFTGHGCGGWRGLGVLRPNPGYSDERMTIGLVSAEADEGVDRGPGGGGHRADLGGELLRLERCTPLALEAALSALEEPVDGRCATAWLLASRHWSR
jgi:ADP-ribose pyrophosphatase